ncbi:substrate-binding periplasmic protein [Thalassotalea piscium]|uniref:Polar amino acid transport system substrate-binding protein n=1 Tax=Thalassotalea piscium TaxID=1230533 RepID=A0A7X0NJB0_9GAMM|nr:transporter substrate-binding domain-containing protein [Thalassotalea piscium]MBB6544341.1 polar amino acid transport system substrate-binding protein [Thalassotalea piscium]
MKINLKCVLASLLLSTSVFAENAVQIEQKTIVAGLNKPPYVIEEDDQGIQLDLMRKAFEDIDVSFIYIPFGRGPTGFQQFNADGLLTVPPDASFAEMYISEPYVYYQNIAVTLLENDFSITSISDLAGKDITAFQNAKKYLGSEYELTSTRFMNYREVPEQDKQIELLFLHRTEVIILDISIFKLYLKSHADSELTKPFKVHYIFGERPYAAGFRTKEMRDTFDLRIKEMRKNGTYQLIYDKYL